MILRDQTNCTSCTYDHRFLVINVKEVDENRIPTLYKYTCPIKKTEITLTIEQFNVMPVSVPDPREEH